MRLAHIMATDQNPCLSRQVGVIVVDPNSNSIVGAGYNGPPEGTPHCNEPSFLTSFFWPQLTNEEKAHLLLYINSELTVEEIDEEKLDEICGTLSKCNECPRNMLGYSDGKRSELCSCNHGERNALNKLPISPQGLIMFCWCGVPCTQCTGSIINAGIKEIHCLKTPDYQSVSRWLFEHGATELHEHSIDDFTPTL